MIVPPLKGLVKKKTLRVSISISVHRTSVLYGYIVQSRPAARPSKGPAKGKLICIHVGNKQSGEFCRQSFGSRCFRYRHASFPEVLLFRHALFSSGTGSPGRLQLCLQLFLQLLSTACLQLCLQSWTAYASCHTPLSPSSSPLSPLAVP